MHAHLTLLIFKEMEWRSRRKEETWPYKKQAIDEESQRREEEHETMQSTIGNNNNDRLQTLLPSPIISISSIQQHCGIIDHGATGRGAHARTIRCALIRPGGTQNRKKESSKNVNKAGRNNRKKKNRKAKERRNTLQKFLPSTLANIILRALPSPLPPSPKQKNRFPPIYSPSHPTMSRHANAPRPFWNKELTGSPCLP
jgi:hypothetical protein